MIKMIALIVKRADMDHDEFRRSWRDVHAPLTARWPGIRGYVQNHAVPHPSQPNPPYDGVAEHLFDSMQDDEAGLASAEGQASFADIPNFLDPEKIQILVSEVVPIV
jgi:uncharacterized protein (TIGR02118 family)